MAVDPHSQTWIEVEALARKIERQAVEALATRGMDSVTTEFERGRIDAARDILGLHKPKT